MAKESCQDGDWAWFIIERMIAKALAAEPPPFELGLEDAQMVDRVEAWFSQ